MKMVFAFDKRPQTTLEAGLSILQTIFICFAVGFGALSLFDFLSDRLSHSLSLSPFPLSPLCRWLSVFSHFLRFAVGFLALSVFSVFSIQMLR